MMTYAPRASAKCTCMRIHAHTLYEGDCIRLYVHFYD